MKGQESADLTCSADASEWGDVLLTASGIRMSSDEWPTTATIENRVQHCTAGNRPITTNWRR